MNKVILMGRIGKDPEFKELANGKVCNFSLATSRKYKDKSGEQKEDTQWHNCQAWGTTADLVNKYVKKGDQLLIEGSVNYEQYEKDGVKNYATKIKVDAINFIAGAKSSDNIGQFQKTQGEIVQAADSADMPF